MTMSDHVLALGGWGLPTALQPFLETLGQMRRTSRPCLREQGHRLQRKDSWVAVMWPRSCGRERGPHQAGENLLTLPEVRELLRQGEQSCPGVTEVGVRPSPSTGKSRASQGLCVWREGPRKAKKWPAGWWGRLPAGWVLRALGFFWKLQHFCAHRRSWGNPF